ncbi:MAG: class I SAM-dependent methyltransferase [Methylovirgula sp.]|uniref:class I SAM-dependent methyltransferase n=1 Tax=Methylovirgula sp. TaxID=1978224 RepID=UPI0030765BD1
MRQRTKYGIDAPRVVRAYIVFGILLALPALINLAWPGSSPIPGPWSIGAALFAVLLLAWAAVMLRSSLVGKMRVRDCLVDALDLSGSERVLDAGCGRGLALIGCAKKLTTGKAVGIDLWAGHLSGNNPEAARANAVAESVADRVEIETGDITRLPFSDAAFDAVISMTVIHNIPSQERRDQAVREFVRVLKPGGRVAIFDLLHTARYAEILRQAGLTVESLGTDLLWLWPCRSLLARKPEAGGLQGLVTASS